MQRQNKFAGGPVLTGSMVRLDGRMSALDGATFRAHAPVICAGMSWLALAMDRGPRTREVTPALALAGWPR